jgi:hypothetical protein
MSWIAFLSRNTTQKIELHTVSEGGSGTELPVISIGVDDFETTETAVRAAGAEVVYGPVKESWGLLFPRPGRKSRERCRQLRPLPKQHLALGGSDILIIHWSQHTAAFGIGRVGTKQPQ